MRDPSALLNSLQVTCDPELLELSLVHRSYAYENGGLPTNERLEFLGDSVLGIVVTDTLYRNYPDLPEGQLARMRASVVNAQALAEVARSVRLGDFIKLGKGEVTSGGSDKTSILADCLEAVIGAVYLSGGMGVVEPFISRLFNPLINEASQLGAGLDWKTSLQELSGQLAIDLPEYRISDSGPDHAKTFLADVVIGGEIMGTGEGSSKKIAEQLAAQQAYTTLADRMTHPPTGGTH
ncbi:MAG: ribonuclease III [Candidatus Nanopelagicales bacterium]|nr:ribonuclease III [Candidatus Nanopelagicales bacterium]